MSTRSRIFVLVAAAVLLVASCDRATESVLGPVTTDSTTTDTTTTDTTEQTGDPDDTAASPTTVSTVADDPDCRGDARTLEFAIDGFAREHGRYPVSQDELVGDWIRRSIDSHETGADGEIVRRPGVPCSRNDPSGQVGLATTADEFFAEFSEDDIEDWGGVECARELATILGAGQEFAEREGRTAPFVDLLTSMDEPIVLWTTDARGDLVAVTGAPCHSLADKNEIQICPSDQRTLTGATRAFVADVRRPPNDRSELIDAGYLGEVVVGYAVRDGDVTVAAGGRCDELRGDSPPGQLGDADCAVEQRTLAIAVEAFIAQNGAVPELERDLVTGGLVRAQSADYDLEGGEIVPSPDSRCR